MLRIGIDGDTLGRKRTGDESYLVGLLNGLLRVDHENEYTLYVRDPAVVRREFGAPANWRLQRVRPTSIWLRYPLGLPLALRRNPVDLLHVQYFVSPFCRCPVVITVHDISFAVRPEYFTWKDRRLLNLLVPRGLRRADRIITDTEYTKHDLSRVYGLDPRRIAVIPLAAHPRYCRLDEARCRQMIAQRHTTDQGFILYVGTLQPRKNVATLINAYASFRRRTGLPHKLLMVGKPKYKYESVFDAIRASRYEDDILLAGFVPDEELPIYYNAADLFVFPSLYEGFGLPVLEAMACGTPVISSTASCLPEVAGDAALLAAPDEPEEFRRHMEDVLGKDGVAADLRERGLRRAAEFSWDRTARDTLAVYRDLVCNRST